jgi:hydrogen cyanide synthase HcnC
MTAPGRKNWDAVIAGGGLIGLSIGYGLARRGLSVLILDEGDVAIRAARGNFGLVWVQGKGAYFSPYADWTMRSAQLWPQLANELQSLGGTKLGLHQSGGLAICLNDDEMQQRRDRLENLRAHQNGRFEFEMLDRTALAELMPGIGPKVVGAAYCPHDGHVNPLFLMRALVAGLERHGGQFAANAPLLAVDRIGDDMRITTPAGQFFCSRLVLAAGLANARLAPMIGLEQSLRPQKGQVVVTEKLNRTLTLPTLLLRQTDEGGLMIGDSHEDDIIDTGVSADVISGIASRALATLPALADISIVRSWAALRVMSRDGHPIYDQSESMPGAFAISCHSGVTLSAAHAFDLAGYVAAGRLGPELDGFSERRFHV